MRRYTPVWYTGTSLVGFKSYRHFFLAYCHTGMPYTVGRSIAATFTVHSAVHEIWSVDCQENH